MLATLEKERRIRSQPSTGPLTGIASWGQVEPGLYFFDYRVDLNPEMSFPPKEKNPGFQSILGQPKSGARVEHPASRQPPPAPSASIPARPMAAITSMAGMAPELLGVLVASRQRLGGEASKSGRGGWGKCRTLGGPAFSNLPTSELTFSGLNMKKSPTKEPDGREPPSIVQPPAPDIQRRGLFSVLRLANRELHSGQVADPSKGPKLCKGS